MRPIDFEDTIEALAWEPIERALEDMMERYRRQKRLNVILEHRAWEKHWRTRLYIFLTRLAAKVYIDEPEIPNPNWREIR